MIGAIIGDIIGSRFEWHNIKTKDFELFHKYCAFTDDTVMTIAVAKALMLSNKNYEELSKITIKTMHDLGNKYINSGFGGHFKHWLFCKSNKPYNSYGNGSAMRISAVGFIANSIEEVKRLSYEITKITHNHYEGIKGAEATAIAIYLARIGKTKEEIKKYIEDNYYKLDFTLDEIREKYTFDVTCQGSVPQSIVAFLESNSYEDAIRNAISIGGDSDTLACITGGIAEAFYGIPKEIYDKSQDYLFIDLKEILKDVEDYFGNSINKIIN